MSDQDLKASIEQPRDVTHWGRVYRVTPLLVAEVFGDGKVLMAIQPLNTRPERYVVRVDSAIAQDRDCDAWLDFLELEVYPAIEEQFGSREDDGEPDWPALNLNAGCSWWEVSL